MLQSSDKPSATVRADVQWMRALAVSLVMVYHAAPTWVSGGFVGVDVFFVISGFLITSSLVARPPTTGRAFAEFWGRRIRRLLPASFLVIAVSGLAAWVLLPNTLLPNTLQDALSATLYMQNWHLAWQATDYLAAGTNSSVYQHFWSLSVEEQFYIVWPLLVGLVVWLLRRNAQRLRLVLGVVVGVLVGLSLGYSIHLSAVDSASAYFVTPTRAWELGIGGLLAISYPLFMRMGRFTSLILRFAGIAMMCYAGFAFDGHTPFPSWYALIPTVGGVLFLAAGAPWVTNSQADPLRVCWAFRPVRFIGDISYSLYLWHWPIIVCVPYVFKHPLGLKTSIGAIALAIIVSGFSYYFVEQKFRGLHPLGHPLRRSFIFAAVGMTTFSVSAWAIGLQFEVEAQSGITGARATVDSESCWGGGVLLNPACKELDIRGSRMLMSPLDTKADQFGIEFKCRWEKGMDEYPVCDFGPDAETADHSVVIYGNSHSQAWMPAMRKLSRVLNFHLTSYLSQSCYPATADVVQSFNEEDKQRCIDSWPVNFQRIVELNPDLVVMANRAPMTSYESWEVVLQQFADAGIQVLVIRDFPSPYRAFPAEERNNIPDCVASVGDDYQKCDGVRSIWLNDDPAALAAYALNSPLVQVLDLTDAFCNETICWSVVGGLIVYWDSDHLSGTYAYSLWPYLEPVISELLSKR